MIDTPLSERSLTERVLRVPLVAKLAGANALVVLVAWVATWLTHSLNGGGEHQLLFVLAAALAAGLLVNATLVGIALQPIRSIENTAERFWKGDLAARVPWSAVADKDIERLSEALNLLLETNERERVRLRALAEGVMRYEEHVRVETARVLHESHAQLLSGLLFQISAAMANCESEDCRVQLEAARLVAKQGVEDLRELSARVHPRLLDDFGLIAAVRQMARSIQKDAPAATIEVNYDEVFTMQEVSKVDKLVLYRGTEEAIRSALARRASAVNVCIRAKDNAVEIDVNDNSSGVRLPESDANTTLWLIQERLAFIGGSCVVRTDPNFGTRVSMRLPLKRDNLGDLMPSQTALQTANNGR